MQLNRRQLFGAAAATAALGERLFERALFGLQRRQLGPCAAQLALGAIALLDEPRLGHEAVRWVEIAELWHNLAEAAVPLLATFAHFHTVGVSQNPG